MNKAFGVHFVVLMRKQKSMLTPFLSLNLPPLFTTISGFMKVLSNSSLLVPGRNGHIFPGVKRPELEANNSLPMLKMSGATQLRPHMPSCLADGKSTFTFVDSFAVSV
jgi:hypothetical protein